MILKCKCGREILGRHRIDGVPVCKDCYYEGLGRVVEQHPIGVPYSVALQTDRTDKEICEQKIDFCLQKCGEWYCGYMRNRTGYPCI